MGPPIALIIVIYFPFYPVSMCTKVLGVQGIAHVISGLKRPFLWLLMIFPFLAQPSYLTTQGTIPATCYWIHFFHACLHSFKVVSIALVYIFLIYVSKSHHLFVLIKSAQVRQFVCVRGWGVSYVSSQLLMVSLCILSRTCLQKPLDYQAQYQLLLFI